MRTEGRIGRVAPFLPLRIEAVFVYARSPAERREGALAVQGALRGVQHPAAAQGAVGERALEQEIAAQGAAEQKQRKMVPAAGVEHAA